MRLILKNEKLAVYDDVIEDAHIKTIRDYVQKEEYALPYISGWHKVWRLGDCSPMGSKNYKYSERPFNNGMDIALVYMEEMAKNHPQLNGWDEIILRSYLYPRGSKLSWHNDLDYKGAMVLYTHDNWGSTWGGELLVAEVSDNYEDEIGPHLNHEKENKFIMDYGVGQYILPKPNRLVITYKNVWHNMCRVDPDAGDHVRSSIVGFFQ